MMSRIPSSNIRTIGVDLKMLEEKQETKKYPDEKGRNIEDFEGRIEDIHESPFTKKMKM